MERVHTDSGYSWARLGLTMMAGIIINAGMWLVITIMPAIEADFGSSRAATSLPFTMTMVGFGLGNFLIGRAVDRYGVTPVLIGSALAAAVSFWMAALAPSILVLSAAQLCLGLACAAGFGPLIADISHWFLRRRGIAVALVACANYLSGAIWPVVLADVLAADGWRMVYQSMAWITVVGVVPIAFMLRRPFPESGHLAAAKLASANAASVGLGPRPLAVLLGVAGIGCCVAMSMPQVHIVAYCVDLGYGPAVGAEMLALMLLGGVVSRIVSGLLADRLGGVRILLIGSVLQCLALFAYLPSDAMVPLYVISTAFGLAQGGIVPSYALIVREYMPPRAAGTWVGLVMMTTIFGMALGGWMSGWIYDASGSYIWAFWNGIIWNGLNIAIVLWLLGRSRTPGAVQPA